MYKIILIAKGSALILLLSAFIHISTAHASVTNLGLCPPGYDQGTVTTGFVDCYRSTSQRDDRSEAEALRIEREALCNATPNAQITSSQILTTSSGRFYAELTCTVTRTLAPGTVLCPGSSTEVYRAFDTVICEYFGDPVATMQAGQDNLMTQSGECAAVTGGRVLDTSITEGMFSGITYYSTLLTCAIPTAAVDVIACPYGYDETGRTNDILECEVSENSFATLAEAQDANVAMLALCTDTTAGLGTVTENLVGVSSASNFFNTVVCDVSIPRFTDFADQGVVRACDASCTEVVTQTRACVNGGQVGGPGCFGLATQDIERRCNTGPSREGLCPLVNPASNIVPLLLLED